MSHPWLNDLLMTAFGTFETKNKVEVFVCLWVNSGRLLAIVCKYSINGWP